MHANPRNPNKESHRLRTREQSKQRDEVLYSKVDDHDEQRAR